MISQLKLPSPIAIAVGAVEAQLTLGMSWADKFNDGQRTIELWYCPKQHESDCPTIPTCELIGAGTILGVWAGVIKNVPMELFRLNGVESPNLTYAFDAALKAGIVNLAPTSLITVVIYERKS